MKRDAVVINSSSRRVAGEVRDFVMKAGCTDTIYTVHTAGAFRETVRQLYPRLAFIETNCWYEASQYMTAQYAEAFPRMSIAVFGYERLTACKAAGFISLGAESYVDLRLDEKEIAEAFNRIIHRKQYLPPWVEKTAGKYSLSPPEQTWLRRCEIPVMRLAALGNGIEESALKLGIGRGTVRNRISAIHQKFNIHTVTDVISLALRIGVIRPEELVSKEIDVSILEKEASDVRKDRKRNGAY
ncbi:MAG: LuxR C-terminal-related transcriptional regulator [Spirochaetaceae bacterium]|jgi:DNA-binding NarL/FixJ family response regulator|nr:LuxR C-terminal-related transcriptional regulator [Spirochaetaceae bacterium]